jgi:hypothetical protein
MFCIYYRDSVTRFFASGFFHESPSPKPLKITLGSFRILSKILGDIRTTGVNETGGKFPTGVNDTGGNIAAGINNTSGKLCKPVSTTPAANFATSFARVFCTKRTHLGM